MNFLFVCFADVEPLVFSFRVKFFPADPFRLTGNSKIMIYQQLKRDLIHGRLYCSAGEAAALGSLIVQGIFISSYLFDAKIGNYEQFYLKILWMLEYESFEIFWKHCCCHWGFGHFSPFKVWLEFRTANSISFVSYVEHWLWSWTI